MIANLESESKKTSTRSKAISIGDGAVPAIKDPGHDPELQMVSETASNVCVLLAIGTQVLVTL